MSGGDVLAFVQHLSVIERVAFGLFLVGTVAFFAWVAVLTFGKK